MNIVFDLKSMTSKLYLSTFVILVFYFLYLTIPDSEFNNVTNDNCKLERLYYTVTNHIGIRENDSLKPLINRPVYNDSYRPGSIFKLVQALVALQEGVRVDLNNKNLIKNYFFHPLMSFKIILAIHFEAFRLWIKGVKFIKKKIKIKNNITIEN